MPTANIVKGKEQTIIYVVSILIGILFVCHYVLIPLLPSKEGSVFLPFTYPDESGYFSIMKKAADGNLIPGDSQLYEHKIIPYLNWFPFFIGAVVAKVIGSSIAAFIIVQFFAHFLIFLFLFKLLYSGFGFSSSLMIALAVMVAWKLAIHFPPLTPELLKGLWKDITLVNFPVLSFLRPLPATVSFSILTLTLYNFQKIIMNKAQGIVLTAFLASLLLNSYYHHWTFAYAIFSVMSIIVFLSKQRILKKKILKFWGALILFSIPFIFLYLIYPQMDITKRITYNVGRYIETIMTLRYLVLLIIFIFIVKPFTSKKLWIYPSFLIAGIVCFNIQLITGFTILPDHYVLVVEPFAVLCGLIIFIKLLKKYKLEAIIVKGITVLLILLAFFLKYKTFMNINERYFYPKEMMEIYDWLNNKTAPKSVVVTLDLPLIYTIPAMTHNRIFLPSAFNTYASEKEILSRIYWVYKFFDFPPQVLKNDLTQDEWVYAFFNYQYAFNKHSDIRQYEFPPEVKKKIMSIDGTLHMPNAVLFIPDNIKKKIFKSYENYYKLPYEITTKNNFKKDYILIEKNIEKISPLAYGSYEIKEVFSNNKYAIYSLKTGEK